MDGTLKPNRAQIEALIRCLAPWEGVSSEIVIRQCEAESSFNPDALNAKSGAIGLFQLMPATAKDEKVNPHRWHENVFGGVRYLGKMLRMFGTVERALAAYNWGPGNMRKCIDRHGDEWRKNIPSETRGYLRKILL